MLSLIGRYGYLIVFLGVMIEGIGIPLPGETVLITAGALAHRGSLTLWETMVMGSLGAVMGGQAGYFVGRFGGRPFVVRWGRYVFITPERLARAESFFERHGGKAVFFGRFITGLRVFGALVAGMSRMSWRKFTLYSVLGGVVWATAAVVLGYFLWASLGLVEHWIGRISLLLAAALILVVVLRRSYRKVMTTRRDENLKESSPDPDKRPS
ncbi:MAG: DedA family protein [Actinomycetota bacterium]|nr:DedA family protein [Actinomycetota bacterium]